MTTITLKIDKRTKAGKAFLAMSEIFFKNVEGIEIVETNTHKTKKEESFYNPDFVAKIKRAEKRADYIEVNPKDIWGSLGLK